MSTPHFLVGKFEALQRSQPQRFTCPICNNVFRLESKLWAHAKGLHLEDLAIAGQQDVSEVRRKFSERSRKSVRTSREAEPTKSQPSLTENNPPRPSANARLVSSTRLGHGFEKRNYFNDKGTLLTPQKNGSRSSRSTPEYNADAVSYNPNPRKRIAARESEFQEPVADKQFGDRGGGARRAKASSGVPPGKDPEFWRGSLLSLEAGLARRSSSKRLFNPDTDNSSNTTRRNKARESTAARRIYDQRTHVFRSRQAPSSEKDDIRQQKISQNYENEQIKLEKNPSGIQGVRLSGSLPNLQDEDLEQDPEILLQPETRPISHDQLFLEVKGIYAGLLMVESKCIEVDSRQSKAALERDPSRPTKLSDEQFHALIALHKTLLHEHHDFFLASQHPSANIALSKLPEHYSMPARMWRHGIQSFLEVLRHRLPESLDHMLAFIYIAYSMVALLYETMSSFESTWIECLGDLGRYRMAIEDDMRDREVWSGVARFWYGNGADKDPNQGRLYHHLAILARHSSLQQLSLYSKALTCVTPFESARSSIMTLFSPILSGKDSSYLRSMPFETMFIKVHGMLFSGTALENYDASLSRLIDLLDRYITRLAAKFKEQGIFAAIADMSALFEYGGGARQSGATKSTLQLCFKPLRDAENRAIDEAKARAKKSILQVLEPIATKETKVKIKKQIRVNDPTERIPNLKEPITTRRDLPMIIGGRTIRAMPDTAADGNFINSQLASKLQIPIRKGKSDRKSFQLGNGKFTKALGRIRASCAFAKDSIAGKMKCWFYVLDHLAVPMIMGSPFLEETKTLSEFTQRLEDRSPGANNLPLFNLISSCKRSKNRLNAFINGRSTQVRADTGSDCDLISPAHAKAQGYKIDRRAECRTRLRLADNTVAETIGKVQVTLSLDNESDTGISRVFDVLPGLPCEVLLGVNTLNETEAFTAHANSFVKVPPGSKEPLTLNLITYIGKKVCAVGRYFSRRRRWGDTGNLPRPSAAKELDNFHTDSLTESDTDPTLMSQQQGNPGGSQSTSAAFVDARLPGEDMCTTMSNAAAG